MAENKQTEIPGLKVEPIEDVSEPSLDLSESSLQKAVRVFDAARPEVFEKNKALTDLSRKIQEESDTELRQVGRVEVKAFDASFLDALEVGLTAVGKILANPRTFIKEMTEIESVEKAKKVSVVSIRHFATHSQYLRTVQDNGEVIPDKILTIHSETNTAIYENRFVMTLIKRCLSFIEQRYKYIEEHGETLDSDELFIKSKTKLGGVDYNLTMRLKASIPSADAGNSEKNDRLLNRLEGYRSLCSDFLHSSFMTQMKGAKDVTSPVHMTNMLLKHPDYHAAYELWEFIDQYESLGVSYDVKETTADFSEEYLKNIYQLIGNAILTLHSRHLDKAEIKNTQSKRLTPQVLFTLDQLSYDDGKFVYDAYPDAAEHPSVFDVLDEQQRKAKVERQAAHLSVQEKASTLSKKKIQRTKDQRAYEEAVSRDEEEDKRVAESSERAKKRQEEEEKRALEEQQRLQKEKARKLQEEEEAYQAAKRRILEG